MELKHMIKFRLEVVKQSLNCTVMELKQPDAKINGSNAMVLIVPLWN